MASKCIVRLVPPQLPLPSPSSKSYSPSSQAIHLDIAKSLVNALPGEAFSATDDEGNTPLHIACTACPGGPSGVAAMPGHRTGILGEKQGNGSQGTTFPPQIKLQQSFACRPVHPQWGVASQLFQPSLPEKYQNGVQAPPVEGQEFFYGQ
jgi:hypothetical protein